MTRTILADPSVSHPRPAPFRRPFKLLSERRIEITYGRGIIEALHRVDVDETDDEVIVTVWVGTRPLSGPGFSTLQLKLETLIVELEKPLLGRAVTDGAAKTN